MGMGFTVKKDHYDDGVRIIDEVHRIDGASIEPSCAWLSDVDVTPRVWLNGVEVTSFIRTGDQPVTVEDGQVVFANTGKPWYPGETGVRLHR